MTVAKVIGGVAAGAGALAIIDAVTGGHVRTSLSDSTVQLRAFHQQGYVLRHLFEEPGLYGAGRSASAQAQAAQDELFGTGPQLDNGGDAFRHAYAAAMFTVGLASSGTELDRARELVIEGGEAHERDGYHNNSPLAHEMDRVNNRVGTELVGTGRGTGGAWLTEPEVRALVLDALGDGRLQRIGASATPHLAPTTRADLPAPEAGA